MGRALIIDDSLTIRRIVEMALEANGWSSKSVGDGKSGLAICQAENFDLIFLDYVLPDMSGLDVFKALKEHQAHPNVVLMTAKEGVAAREFVGALAPWAIMAKPFTADNIQRLLTDTAPSTSDEVPASTVSRESLEKIAKLMYGLLRPHLESVPKIVRSPPPGNLAAALAKKILTPTTVEGLVSIVREQLAGEVAPTSAGQGLEVRGTLAAIDPEALLQFLLSSRQSGVLEFSTEGAPKRYLHFLDGLPMMVASPPTHWGEVPAGIQDEAERALAENAKPPLVSLRERGLFPQEHLREALNELTKNFLVEFIKNKAGTYLFRAETARPAWLEAYGTPVTNTAIRLEAARHEALHPLDGGAVLERVPGFSRKVQSVDLHPDEQMVLQRVDGRRTVREIASGTSHNEEQVSITASRLVAAELLRLKERPEKPFGLVMVWDPDREGFVRPLIDRLFSRTGDVQVEELPQRGLADAIAMACPKVVVVNASIPGCEAERLPGEVRQRGLSVLTVGILDQNDPEREEDLRAAGFDAVYAKPVAIAQLRQSMQRASASSKRQAI